MTSNPDDFGFEIPVRPPQSFFTRKRQSKAKRKKLRKISNRSRRINRQK